MKMTKHANLNKGKYLQCLFNNGQIRTVASRIRKRINLIGRGGQFRYSDSYRMKKKLPEYRTNIAIGLRLPD
jgi:hypothetical protein